MLGEFQTLVDPGRAIPPYISVLTGITTMMVAAAPRIGAVLPGFLEFARGAVLVAHNAPFDLGFLKAACAENGIAWPAAASVDTAVLARRLLTRDEVPNCKLATLAPFFRATTSPTHRALDDARATVDVLHGLFERLGPLGITTLEELTGLTRQVDPERLRKRHLADAVPRGPGVYLFRGPRDEPLYVGTSNDLRSRVRSYFSAGEQRSRITEMVALSQRVDAIPCAHDLEAAVRELRLIAEHKPRYNRRSRFPERALWVRLTEEPFPRLSVVRRVRPGHRGVPRARSPTGAPPTRPSPRSTSRSRCGSARRGSPRGCLGTRLRPGRHGPVRRAVHRRAVGRRVRRRSRRCSGRRSGTTRAPSSRRCCAGSTGWPPRSATRTPRCSATGSPCWSGRCGAGSGWSRWPRCPSWSSPGRTAPAAGTCPSSAAAGWSPPAAHRRRRRCASTLAGPAGDGGDTDRSGRRARRLGRRDRTDPALDGEAGHPAGRARPAPWPARPRAPAPFNGFLARVEAGRTDRDPFADGRSLGTRARPERVTADAGGAAAHR